MGDTVNIRIRAGTMQTCIYTLLIAFIPASAYSAGMCVAQSNVCAAGEQCGQQNVQSLPRVLLNDMEYAGAFKFPGGIIGESEMGYSRGIMEISGDSLFIIGHNNHEAIAEFTVPELVVSTKISELNSTGPAVQVFSRYLDRVPEDSSTTPIDDTWGLEMIDGKLIINAGIYYDASSPSTKKTTAILHDPSNLATSAITGFFEFPGGASAGGYISPIPPEWQTALDGDYLTGFAANTSIRSRHSSGPSAHSFYKADLFAATLESPTIPLTTLMKFKIDTPLHEDLNNDLGENDLWSLISTAWFGFIIPNTRTFMAVGSHAGLTSGLGYKITQTNGRVCGGSCPFDSDDEYPYYWMFDVDDFIKVKNGVIQQHEVRPYEWGVFPSPFQPEIGARRLTGGTYDSATGILYITVNKGNDEQGQYGRTPIVIAYRFH